jgi:hypothetical protein
MSNTSPEAHQLVVSHHLEFAGDEIVDSSGERFDREAYSRMKYGDRSATQVFGQELAQDLIDAQEELVTDAREPELLVAYKAVPPACYYLSRVVLSRLNEARLDYGNEPGRVVQVYKGSVAGTDYAASSQADRDAELRSIDFTLEGRTIADKRVIILDDIRITGAAERRMLEVIDTAHPLSTTLGYIARFNAEQAAQHPAVESELNSSVIVSARDVAGIIEAGEFDLNIRTLKLLLAAPVSELESVLETAPFEVVQAIYEGALNTGVDFTKRYASGFETVKNFYKELAV